MTSIDLSPQIMIEAQPRQDRHRLAGTFAVNGQPAVGLITLFNRTSNVLLAARYSLPDGNWQLAGLPEYPPRSLRIEATDNSGQYNAQVYDYITQTYGPGVEPEPPEE